MNELTPSAAPSASSEVISYSLVASGSTPELPRSATPASPIAPSTDSDVAPAGSADLVHSPRWLSAATGITRPRAEREAFTTATFTDQGAATQLWLPRAAPGELTDLSRSGRRQNRGRRSTWRGLRRSSSAPASALPVASAAAERSIGSYDLVTVAEATGFAVRFAADYLSWDEEEPARREAALRQYLADPSSARSGWSGLGRQRAELVVPGRTVEFRGAIVVEITARVVLYERTGPAPTRMGDHRAPLDDPDWPPMGEATPPLATDPASAPAPSAPGWAPGAGWWVPLAPPVRRHSEGRLVIDLGLDLSATS